MATAGAAAVTGSCGGAGGSNTPTPGPPAPPPPPPPPPPVPGPPPPTGGNLQSIDHIIVLMQENRSFDCYFGKLPEYRTRNNFPNADQIDGLPADASNPSLTLDGKLDPTNPIAAFELTTVCTDNLSSTWNESCKNWNFNAPASDTPTMDGFVGEAANWARNNAALDVAGKRAMGYYTEKELPFYYALASHFAISDRMFCSVRSHTQPNRMYFLAATSAGRITSLKNYPPPLNQAVDVPTIFDLCNQHNVSWKIYNHDRNTNPNGFTYLQLFKSFLAMGGNTNPKIVKGSQFAIDAQNGNLPQFSIIEIGNGLDEHPGNNVNAGALVVESYFRALFNSPSWKKSAMILTYDEHGACYDHVPPPTAVKPDNIAPMFTSPFDIQVDFNRYGFRVPFVMVSPWAKKNGVSHVVSDHTSILKLVETRFSLPNLTARDAAASDLTDMFDFSQMSFPTPPDLPSQPASQNCNRAAV